MYIWFLNRILLTFQIIRNWYALFDRLQNQRSILEFMHNFCWSFEITSSTGMVENVLFITVLFIAIIEGLWCLTPLSTIFQLYRGGELLVEETEVPRGKRPTCPKSLTNFSPLPFSFLTFLQKRSIVKSCYWMVVGITLYSYSDSHLQHGEFCIIF